MIRHAVSIDERRAKFRSDLISGNTAHGHNKHADQRHRHRPKRNRMPDEANVPRRAISRQPAADRFRRPSRVKQSLTMNELPSQPGQGSNDNDLLKPRPGSPRNPARRAQSPVSSIESDISQLSMPPPRLFEDDDELDEAAKQDLEELWFPGCHADLGGGWPMSADEELPLSHGPLVWMVREAQRAGLDFDEEMLVKLKCGEDFQGNWSELDVPPEKSPPVRGSRIPSVQVTSATPDLFSRPRNEKQGHDWVPRAEPEAPKQSEFHRSLHTAATRGRLHDCLKFNNGLGMMSVISWKMMEYLPFRRMDLKPDGSWAAISFP